MAMEIARPGLLRAHVGDGHERDAAPVRHDVATGHGNVAEEVGDVWVTVGMAAEKAGVSTGTVRQWYRSGSLPTKRSEGDRGAFLVPLEEALRLARLADGTGDMGQDAIIDLDAGRGSIGTDAGGRDTAVAADARAVEADARAAEADARAVEAEAKLADAEARAADAEARAADAEARAADADARARAADGRVAEAEHARAVAVAEAASSADALAQARVRTRELTSKLEELTGRLDFAEHAVAEAVARASQAEMLLDESARHTEFLREQLEEANVEIRTRRSRVATLEEELRVARSFASVTDHSWLDAGVPGYRGPLRDQAGGDNVDTPVAERGTRFPGPLPADPLEHLDEDAFPEPFAVDELEAEGADEIEPRPAPAPRRRRVNFHFGSAADDLLPENEAPKHKRR